MQLPPLPVSRRLAVVVVAAVVSFAGSPGIAGVDGSVALAVAGVALWAWAASRPLGPRPWRARLAEWLGGSLAGGLMMWWTVYVVVFGALYIGAGWGVYFVVMGAALRLLRRRLPLPLAVGLAWTGVELVRALVPPPFGLSWFRLGYYTHAHGWLAGASRIVGIEGLTFVLACLGGGLAALALERRARPAVLVSALAPLAAAVLCARVVPAPLAVDGPRVLLVQPGFSQERKMHDDVLANLSASRDLTHRAAAEAGPVDLVAWGESMLYIPLCTSEAEDALREGTARNPPWAQPVTVEDLEGWRRAEEHWVRREIMTLGDRTRPFPAGTSFVVGGEYFDLVEGELRRKVALVVYDAAGNRSEPAYKRFLVPLGETFFGLERFGWVRDLALAAAGYLPDLLPGDETGVIPIRGRDGRTWRASGSVCFDNAHPWPYVDALAAGEVDFHLVVSNEAWYRESCEMDQMIAFSRLLAQMTGRSFVRATNSGVSAVIGPDGRELGRVRDARGRDRAAAGFGAWTVPVPPPGAAVTPPYVRWNRLSEWLWVALLGLACLVVGRLGNRPAVEG